MISKMFDGITDVFFGNLIDRTKSNMGKARPWMFYSGFPLAISMILIFAIPKSWGQNVQYVWFFIFYTANNISYAMLSALITKNESERVSLGFNSLASLVCKEVVEEDKKESDDPKENATFISMLKSVLTNKYYLLLLGIYLFMYTNTNLATSIGVYYFQYIMGNAFLLGVVSLSSIVMIFTYTESLAGMAGWLLSAVGYVGTAEVQTQAINNMIKFIYGGIPLILTIFITLCLAFMKVDEENKKLEAN